MNYRHAYHAGNFADVLKHIVLALVIEALKRKPAPFAAVDTHAGVGLYDLWALAANKTLEYKDGIGRLFDLSTLPEALKPYLGAVRSLNGQHLRFYPGSPALTRSLMRPQDRLILAELHPEDADALKERFKDDRQVAVHGMDGWSALKAFAPPPEKRGLMLIDPPFEAKGEFERLARGLIAARKRWPQGIFLAWYPIKDREGPDQLKASLLEAGLPAILSVEMAVRPLGGEGLGASGLILLNPPWRLDETLKGILPWLMERLDQGGGAWDLDWLAPDT
jgi:23S rRNA (adenine2030-N6)-methyltransferase